LKYIKYYTDSVYAVMWSLRLTPKPHLCRRMSLSGKQLSVIMQLTVRFF